MCVCARMCMCLVTMNVALYYCRITSNSLPLVAFKSSLTNLIIYRNVQLCLCVWGWSETSNL